MISTKDFNYANIYDAEWRDGRHPPSRLDRLERRRQWRRPFYGMIKMKISEGFPVVSPADGRTPGGHKGQLWLLYGSGTI